MADIQKVSFKEQLEKNLEHLGKMETQVLSSTDQVQKQVRHTVSSWTWKVYTAIIFLTVFGVLIPNTYYINEEWQRAVETRTVFGVLIHKAINDINEESQRAADQKFIRITGPGLHLKLPFLEKYQQYRVDVQRIQLDKVKARTKKAKLKTKNEEKEKDYEIEAEKEKDYEIEAEIVLLYRLPEEQIQYIYSNKPDFKKKLEKYLTEIFTEEVGKTKMEDIPKERKTLADRVFKKIKKKIKDVKLKLELYDFSIFNYSWSEEFRRDIRKAYSKIDDIIADEKKFQDKYINQKNEIEDQIKVVQATAYGKVENIKARRDADLSTSTAKVEEKIKKMTAAADAYAICIKGKAQAEAAALQAQIRATHQELVKLEKIKRWDGKLPDCHHIQEIFPFMSQTSSDTLLTILLQQPSMVKKPEEPEELDEELCVKFESELTKLLKQASVVEEPSN